ncbi:MAG TPA: hypothetical protein VE173_05470 [Longimicrobiales bacterium]|nr:hypothetical protein [Longimicrobiales bacterium]
MSDRPAVRGILFAHGRMAEGMVDAVRQISGAGEDALVALSNDGRAPRESLEAIERIAAGAPVIVFTDLLAGSCATAACLSGREHPERAVICGVNLPMLLDFVFHREMAVADLVERLLSKGQQGMRVLQTPA